jgi:hypothetical protein
MILPAIFKDLFWPYEKNNYKARLLHPSSLVILKVFFVIFQVALLIYPTNMPVALAYTGNISADEVIKLTNEARQEKGLLPLRKNEVLTEAALAKGTDMFARGYWAHNAPDGTEPWQFLIQAGYQYKYAGENLARDFSNAKDVVAAWLASPSHRENLLSSRYEDIGVAVIEGELNGVKTTIVVQFFGTQLQTKEIVSALSTTQSPNQQKEVLQAQNFSLNKQASLKEISPFELSRNLAIFIVLLLIVLFVIDIIVVKVKRIPRFSSHGIAHLLFLIMVLTALLTAKSGVVL